MNTYLGTFEGAYFYHVYHVKEERNNTLTSQRQLLKLFSEELGYVCVNITITEIIYLSTLKIELTRLRSALASVDTKVASSIQSSANVQLVVSSSHFVVTFSILHDYIQPEAVLNRGAKESILLHKVFVL